MRFKVVVSASALVLGAFAMGCGGGGQNEAPARSAASVHATASVHVAARPQPTPLQALPAPEAAADEQADTAGASDEPPSSDEDMGLGVTEAQAPEPSHVRHDYRREGQTALEEAATQIDRLGHAASWATESRQLDMTMARGDLEAKRTRLLEAMRSLGPSAALGDASQLPGSFLQDLADLKDAVRASYAIMPAVANGMPGPAPLPSSQLP